MNEIIIVGGEKYTATKVETGLNTISFKLVDLTENEAKKAFKMADSLSVGDGEIVYGEYPDVEFESLSIGADGSITITMHILTGIEKQIRDLQVSQDEQDAAIAAMMFGGEGNE